MTDSAAGGPGADRTYLVHYRRLDGTEATAPFETAGDRCRYSWTAPEDCVAVTEIEYPAAGGGGSASVVPLARPEAVAPGMTFTFPEAATEREIREQATYLAESGRTFTEGGHVTDWPLILAEKDAEIARLTAELDATRTVPVEYVITAALEAAMAADPHREDGMILRVTDGKRQAYVWKAAAKTWEQVP